MLEQLKAVIITNSAPISYEQARQLVAGKTEKPHGIDPAKHFLDTRGVYRLGLIPLGLFKPNEIGQQYDTTVDIDRAQGYALRDPATAPPIIAGSRKSSLLSVIDGGHRISAARIRGDVCILALVKVGTQSQEDLLIDRLRSLVNTMDSYVLPFHAGTTYPALEAARKTLVEQGIEV